MCLPTTSPPRTLWIPILGRAALADLPLARGAELVGLAGGLVHIGHHLRQPQRGARGRVLLLPVVQLHHLGLEGGAQHPRQLARHLDIRVTPTLMLGAMTMATCLAASAILALSDLENPVEPTTSATFCSAQMRACSTEASGEVKSITASGRALAMAMERAEWSVTSTSRKHQARGEARVDAHRGRALALRGPHHLHVVFIPDQPEDGGAHATAAPCDDRSNHGDTSALRRVVVESV